MDRLCCGHQLKIVPKQTKEATSIYPETVTFYMESNNETGITKNSHFQLKPTDFFL